jgi:hypothetical protein
MCPDPVISKQDVEVDVRIISQDVGLSMLRHIISGIGVSYLVPTSHQWSASEHRRGCASDTSDPPITY